MKVVVFWVDYFDGVCKVGLFVGVVIEVVVDGVLVGWGVLIYGKFDIDLIVVMMLINVVKGVEVGNGFDVVSLIGEDNVDEICIDDVG